MARASEDVELQPLQLKDLFNKYDLNRDGVIELSELRAMLQAADYAHDLPDHAFRRIIDLSDRNRDGHLNFSEFQDLVRSGAIPQGVVYRLLNNYVHTLVPRRVKPGTSVPDGKYEEAYTCCPPPVALFSMCLLQVILFVYDLSVTGSTYSVNGPVASVLIYDPHKRHEAWRFITYMFVHVGEMHIVMNIVVLLILGIPLEMVHRWWRVLIIYFAGVLAGSLGTSVADPNVYLAGASGGVYAIITAHLATIIMNWSEMSFPAIQLLVFAVLMGADVGNAVYQRYVAKVETQIGYVAHLAGAVAGLLVGIYVLKNLEVKSWEQKLWWAALALYVLLMAICIIWNIAFPNYFPKPHTA